MTSGLEGSRLQLRHHILKWRWLDLVWFSYRGYTTQGDPGFVDVTEGDDFVGFCARGSYGEWLWCYGKAVSLQAWSGPEGSRKLRFPDYMTTAQDGGKVCGVMSVSNSHEHTPVNRSPFIKLCFYRWMAAMWTDLRHISFTCTRDIQNRATRCFVAEGGIFENFRIAGRCKLNAVSFTKLNTEATFIRQCVYYFISYLFSNPLLAA
jgi:hypothetical protein